MDHVNQLIAEAEKKLEAASKNRGTFDPSNVIALLRLNVEIFKALRDRVQAGPPSQTGLSQSAVESD